MVKLNKKINFSLFSTVVVLKNNLLCAFLNYSILKKLCENSVHRMVRGGKLTGFYFLTGPGETQFFFEIIH